MRIKFALSQNTMVVFQPDGRYKVTNETGSILLTVEELEELGRVLALAEQSKQDAIQIE